jgi:cobalt-zinc-cadmium efflux system membrane fusion protein
MPRGLAVRALLLPCGLSLALAVALLSGSARADNDYYDSVTGGASARAPAPRLALQTAEIELVAVAQGRQLVIYLDRFDDGTPIENAEIEIAAGEETLRATPVKSGVYVAAADWAAEPGQHQLTFTINGDPVPALVGTLVVPVAKAESAEAPRDDDTNSSGSSPLTISLPIEAVVSIGLGVLVALGLSAFAVFRGARPGAAAALGGPTPRSHGAAGPRWFAGLTHPLRFAAARPGRSIAAALVALLLISLLLLGGGVFGRKDEAQHAMGGVLGLVR